MSAITTINSTDLISASRAVINTNFSNLNSDKSEKANNLSDMTVPNTALNNILPSQTSNSGKVLGTDGTNTSWVSPSGSPLATNLVQGILALSVVAANPLLPIAVGDNDGRMPTQAMRDALAGTGTPSGSNKFVTADTNALNELLTNKSTTTTLGTSNTLYPTQNAVKVYVDNQTFAPVYKNGTGTHAHNTNDTQVIAHGLGKIPKFIRLAGICNHNTSTTFSNGVYNGTTTSLVYGGTGASNASSTKINAGGSGTIEFATVTFDATNITVVWVAAGAGAGTDSFTWEAYA